MNILWKSCWRFFCSQDGEWRWLTPKSVLLKRGGCDSPGRAKDSEVGLWTLTRGPGLCLWGAELRAELRRPWKQLPLTKRPSAMPARKPVAKRGAGREVSREVVNAPTPEHGRASRATPGRSPCCVQRTQAVKFNFLDVIFPLLSLI